MDIGSVVTCLDVSRQSIDIKNTKIWDKLLALFSRFSTSDFLRSNDKRMLVNVVNILFYFSVMRDRYPPPPPSAPPALSPGLRCPPRGLFLCVVTL